MKRYPILNWSNFSGFSRAQKSSEAAVGPCGRSHFMWRAFILDHAGAGAGAGADAAVVSAVNSAAVLAAGDARSSLGGGDDGIIGIIGIIDIIGIIGIIGIIVSTI